MKCLYCAEEIQAEAVVCRYCGNNLFLIKPLLARIDALETRCAELDARLAEIVVPSGDLLNANAAVNRSDSAARIFLPALLSSVVAFVFFYAFRFGSGDHDYFLAASVITPLPFGLWAGLWSKGKHPKRYVIAGTSAGLITVAAVALACYYAGIRWRGIEEILEAIGLYVLGALLLFTTGSLFGDQIESRVARQSPAGHTAEAFAKKLLRLTRQSKTRDVKRVADFIAAVAPVLTFIASIVTAYLTYQAALIKK